MVLGIESNGDVKGCSGLPKEFVAGNVREQPFQCENRQGYLASVARHFNYDLPRIDHPECVFRGGAACRVGSDP